jgi:thiol-disulfide isomerase/thioredoxin
MLRPASVLLVVAALAFASTGSSVQAGNTVGGKAPEIAITDGINGVTAQTTIASLKGSPVLLVVWLPLCPHCAQFMPTVHRVHQKYGAKGLKVLTVTNGKKEYTTKHLSEKGWSFGVGFDWTGTTANRYGITGLPGVKLIGADGNLRTYTGSLDAAIEAELPPAR